MGVSRLADGHAYAYLGMRRRRRRSNLRDKAHVYVLTANGWLVLWHCVDEAIIWRDRAGRRRQEAQDYDIPTLCSITAAAGGGVVDNGAVQDSRRQDSQPWRRLERGAVEGNLNGGWNGQRQANKTKRPSQSC